MSMDLSQFETGSEGEWLELLHPTTGEILRDDDGKEAKILLVGKDSDEYRKAQRAATQRRLKSRSKKNVIDAESLEREAVEVLIACTKDWQGIGDKGEDLPCEPSNVRRVYSTYLWLREQVDEFVEDRGNFMKD